MIQHKIFQIFTISLTLILINCGEKIESTWKTNPILVDGRGNEWRNYPLQYNEDLNIVYGIVNNDTALYYMIRLNDQQLARMLSVRGFTLWANNSDDEEKLLGIHYRDERLREDLMEMMRSQRRQQDQKKNPEEKSLFPRGRFSLAQNDAITDLAINDILGVNAAAGLDNGLYCFEFSMTLRRFPDIVHYLDVNAGGTISVGMEIAGVSEEDQERLKKEMEKNRESMGSGRGGGRGGGSGRAGGRGSGGMRGGGQQMPDMDGEEMWVTVKMAQK